MRLISVIFFYLSFTIINCLIGLLFSLHYGVWAGLVFSILVLMFAFKYSEKIILLLSKARYVTDDEHLINQVKNFSTHLDVNDIKVYWSHVYYNNIYFANSYGGVPSIIIGKELQLLLSKNELNSLIYATILRIKSSASKHRSVVNVLSYFMFCWVFYLRNYFTNSTIKKLIEIFLYPAFHFKNVMYKKNDDTEFFDSKVFSHELLKRDYISAIFKIQKLNSCQPLSEGAFVLTGLSHAQNTTNEVLSYMISQNETSIEERVKTLAGNLK